jgi:uncharacterized membrane protein
MEIGETMLHVVLALLYFGVSYFSWTVLRYFAVTRCRDSMLQRLDKGHRFYAFQRKFCGVHPTENRPV